MKYTSALVLLCLWMAFLDMHIVKGDDDDVIDDDDDGNVEEEGEKNDDDDGDPVKHATPCEVCKFLTTELKSRLDETTKSKEVFETGHGLDRQRRFKYHLSELRLIEALHEPHICEKILEYNVHKEKKGSLRFGKKRSETMDTLHGLVGRGVKVDLGIPEEMWDKPSAEVTDLQRKCFHLVEDYEDEIEDWFFHHQEEQDLMDYLCVDRVLAKNNQECLYEVPDPEEDKKKKKKKKAKKEREDREDRDEL